MKEVINLKGFPIKDIKPNPLNPRFIRDKKFEDLKGNKVSLWTRVLSQGQKETLQSLYYDINLVFNDIDSEIHIYTLNYYNESDLDNVLQKTKGKQMMCYNINLFTITFI